jgi:transcriptional regulator with XRE-family HTH domain
LGTLIGDRLRKARERKNLTQVQVKHRTGVNNKTLSGYEKGVSQPDLETLKILANLYEVSVDWLTGNTDDPSPHRNKNNSGYETITNRQYEAFIREIRDKYPNVNIDDPEIRRKLMLAIDLVLDDYKQKQ